MSEKLTLTFDGFSKEVEVQNIKNIHNDLDDIISELESYLQNTYNIEQEEFFNRLYLE